MQIRPRFGTVLCVPSSGEKPPADIMLQKEDPGLQGPILERNDPPPYMVINDEPNHVNYVLSDKDDNAYTKVFTQLKKRFPFWEPETEDLITKDPRVIPDLVAYLTQNFTIKSLKEKFN